MSLLLACCACVPFAMSGRDLHNFYFFEIELGSDHTGTAQLFFDVGRGINEQDSASSPLSAGVEPRLHRFALPSGQLRGLRFDPSNSPGIFTVGRARVVNRLGRVIRAFASGEIHPENDIKEVVKLGNQTRIETRPLASDPYFSFQLTKPLNLKYGLSEELAGSFPIFFSTLIGTFVLLLLIQGSVRFFRAGRHSSVQWLNYHPLATIGLVSAVSVLWQVHPVVFCGKSFVSPDNATFLLYGRFPTLPAYQSADLEDSKRSDIGAFMYAHIHTASLQRRALQDAELPLWNRYVLCGAPLLGQGQTMFGEILQWIPIAADGAAWAWDTKFVLARWLYAFGAGMAVWLITRSMGGSLVIAGTAAWIGYFFFRLNHPAQFAVCFAPWIIVGWLFLTRALSHRQLSLACLLLFIANWEVFTSGTVKEAYMMLPCVNLGGLLVLLSTKNDRRLAWRAIVAALCTGVVFALVTSPLWKTFLDTLAMSKTSYDTPVVNQIPLWQLVGIFDDMAFRHLTPGESHANPSANLVVLAGLTWLIATLAFRRNRAGFALVIAALFPLSMAFGLVPREWILHTPFLANIYHVGNTFSCPALVLLTIASGVGLADLFREIRSQISRRTTFIAAFLALTLFATYLPHWAAAPASGFFIGYVVSIFGALLSLVTAVFVRRRIGFPMLAGLGCVTLGILLWRHGQYLRTAVDPYVFNPQIRADLHAPSPAMSKVQQLTLEPTRVTGLGMNLYTGSNQLYFQEGIYGIEAVRNRTLDEFAMAAGVHKILFWGGDDFGTERNQSRAAMDMLNVRFYLDRPGFNDPATTGLSQIGTEDLQILESPTAWPRAFFTNRIEAFNDLEEFVHRLRIADGQPFAAIQTHDLSLPKMLSAFVSRNTPTLTTAATNYRLTSNSTMFTVDAKAPGVIVLAETYYPKDFRVFLNDVPASYFPINFLFKGVIVSQPGRYLVRFEYWPHNLTAALIASAIGILLGSLLLFTCFTKKQGGQLTPKAA